MTGFTMRSVLGGPALDLAEVVHLRRKLTDSIAPIVVDGLDEIDILLRIGGEITPAEGDGGVHALRYTVSRRRLTANVVVPASEVGAEGLRAAAATHLLELVRRIAARCAPGDDSVADELRAAVLSAAGLPET